MTEFLSKTWREWQGYIFFFVLVWIPVRSAVVDYSPVPTGSMNPTILEGDVAWIDKLAYSLRVPLTTIHMKQWGGGTRARRYCGGAFPRGWHATRKTDCRHSRRYDSDER